jgi:hypothetical protein
MLLTTVITAALLTLALAGVLRIAGPQPPTAEPKPFITAGMVATFVAAVLTLGIEFGLPIESNQQEAILEVAAIAVTYLFAFLRARGVTSVVSDGWPVFNAATLTTIAGSVLGLLVVFNVLPDANAKAISTFFATAAPIIVGIVIAHFKSTPTHDVITGRGIRR